VLWCKKLIVFIINFHWLVLDGFETLVIWINKELHFRHVTFEVCIFLGPAVWWRDFINTRFILWLLRFIQGLCCLSNVVHLGEENFLIKPRIYMIKYIIIISISRSNDWFECLGKPICLVIKIKLNHKARAISFVSSSLNLSIVIDQDTQVRFGLPCECLTINIHVTLRSAGVSRWDILVYFEAFDILGWNTGTFVLNVRLLTNYNEWFVDW